ARGAHHHRLPGPPDAGVDLDRVAVIAAGAAGVRLADPAVLVIGRRRFQPEAAFTQLGRGQADLGHGRVGDTLHVGVALALAGADGRDAGLARGRPGVDP